MSHECTQMLGGCGGDGEQPSHPGQRWDNGWLRHQSLPLKRYSRGRKPEMPLDQTRLDPECQASSLGLLLDKPSCKKQAI